MQCACGILSSVACPALQYFSTLSHKRHDFRTEKKRLLDVKFVIWFPLQILPGTFLILRKTGCDMIFKKKSSGVHVKCPLFWPYLNEAWNYSTDFRKVPKYNNFMKIRPVGVELFHADRRTILRTRLKMHFNVTRNRFLPPYLLSTPLTALK